MEVKRRSKYREEPTNHSGLEELHFLVAPIRNVCLIGEAATNRSRDEANGMLAPKQPGKTSFNACDRSLRSLASIDSAAPSLQLLSALSRHYSIFSHNAFSHCSSSLEGWQYRCGSVSVFLRGEGSSILAKSNNAITI